MKVFKSNWLNKLTGTIVVILMVMSAGSLIDPNPVMAAEGDLIWFKSYNLDESYDFTEGYSASQTTDGGYIQTGWTFLAQGGDGSSDAFLIKTDADGDTLWTRTYEFHDDVDCCGQYVYQTDDDGYLIFGHNMWRDSEIPPGLPIGVFVIKTNDVGDTLWTRTYDRELDNANYIVEDVCPTTDGGYAIFGFTNQLNADALKGYMIKVDADLYQQWSRVYEPTHSGHVWDNVLVCGGSQTTDGGYMLAGTDQYLSEFIYPDTSYSYLIKVDSSGDTLWTKRVNDDQDAYACIRQTPDGGYICGGSDCDFNLPDPYWMEDFSVSKTDALGNEEWAINMFYEYDDTAGYCNSVCAIPGIENTEYLACGFKYYAIGPDQMYAFYSPMLMRVDNEGNIIWSHCYGEESGEERGAYVKSTTGVQITAAGDYLISGYTENVVYGEYVTARPKAFLALIEGSRIGIDDGSSLPQEFALAQNYPNPFNMSTLISYELTNEAEVKLDIYDILGRKVTTLVDELQLAGAHNITWNAKDVVSGVYFYKIQIDDYTDTKRMLFIK